MIKNEITDIITRSLTIPIENIHAKIEYSSTSEIVYKENSTFCEYIDEFINIIDLANKSIFSFNKEDVMSFKQICNRITDLNCRDSVRSVKNQVVTSKDTGFFLVEKNKLTVSWNNENIKLHLSRKDLSVIKQLICSIKNIDYTIDCNCCKKFFIAKYVTYLEDENGNDFCMCPRCYKQFSKEQECII